MTPSIDHVIAELRSPVPVRAEWRSGVLRDVAALPRPRRFVAPTNVVRQWRMRPLTAIAAGLACALLGAGAATLLLSGPTWLTSRTSLTTTSSPRQRARSTSGADRSMVRFLFVAPYASRVSLVGDFNGWNPSSMPMSRSGDGRAWMVDVPLAVGRHVYAFIVDGDLAPDPAAPRAGDDDFGVPSSVVLVGGGPRT